MYPELSQHHPLSNQELQGATFSRDIRTALATPTHIENMSHGKEKRSALHAVVHAFRAAHQYRDTGELKFSSPYNEDVLRYQEIASDNPESLSIIFLSTPEHYQAIRQAARMRSSMRPLDDKELAFYCKEIRAALTWRSQAP